MACLSILWSYFYSRAVSILNYDALSRKTLIFKFFKDRARGRSVNKTLDIVLTQNRTEGKCIRYIIFIFTSKISSNHNLGTLGV